MCSNIHTHTLVFPVVFPYCYLIIIPIFKFKIHFKKYIIMPVCMHIYMCKLSLMYSHKLCYKWLNSVNSCYLLIGNTELQSYFTRMESQALSKMRSNGLKSMILSM